MNRRQRIADSDMRYLARAWNYGFDGPGNRPQGANIWRQIKQQVRRLPYVFDDVRVDTLHTRWLRVADDDRYFAAVLQLHYRDGYEFDELTVMDALDMFSRR